MRTSVMVSGCSALQIVQRQTRAWPGQRDEAARLGERDIGCTQVWVAEADIRRHRIRHRHVLYAGTIRCDHGNAAVVERGDAHIPYTIDIVRPL